jgi:hypothetical protein
LRLAHFGLAASASAPFSKSNARFGGLSAHFLVFAARLSQSCSCCSVFPFPSAAPAFHLFPFEFPLTFSLPAPSSSIPESSQGHPTLTFSWTALPSPQTKSFAALLSSTTAQIYSWRR